MTGKEALEKIKNNQHYREEKNWIIATPLQNTEEYKAINKELDELAKYKRAFEILKKYKLLILKKDEEINFYGINTLRRAEWLEKEEYELLEELMKCEEDK